MIERLSAGVVFGKVVSNDPIHLILAAIWIVSTIVLNYSLFAIFGYPITAAAKRKWHPWFIFLNTATFTLMGAAVSVAEARSLRGLRGLILLVPAVYVISRLMIRITRFCDHCDATVRSRNSLSPPLVCDRCGSPLAVDFKGPDGDFD